VSLLDIEIEEAEETQVESAEYKELPLKGDIDALAALKDHLALVRINELTLKGDIDALAARKDHLALVRIDELTLKGDIDALAAQVEQIELKTDEDVEEAAIWLRKNKQTQKIVKDFFEEERASTYAAYKAVTDKIKQYTDILTKTERTVKSKMGTYQIEKERKRREEEAKRRAEEEKRRREEEAKQIEAEKAGKPAPIPAPELPPAPVIQEEEKAPEGISYIEAWTFEVEDMSKIPLEYLAVDEKKIRAVVKSLKGDAKIPGVRVFAEKQVRAR
jgi:hypothetical protein